MRVLGLDTATSATAAALVVWEGEAAVAAEGSWEAPGEGGRPTHATRLLTLVEELCAGERPDLLAVGVGPGSFTGLRIGVSIAQGLARGFEVPVVPIVTLDALRAAAQEAMGPDREVVALIDARRGEAFVAGDRGRPAVVRPAELDTVVRHGTLAVGDGAVRYRGELEAVGAEVPEDDSPLHRVDARFHCRLARSIAPAERVADVQPLYLREPDAKTRAERR